MSYWILDGHTPVKTDSINKWGEFFEDRKNRTVATTEIKDLETLVSTVFLGINHNFQDPSDKDPILFETMIFGGDGEDNCFRYRTWDEAFNGHWEQVAKMREKLAQKLLELGKKRGTNEQK